MSDMETSKNNRMDHQEGGEPGEHQEEKSNKRAPFLLLATLLLLGGFAFASFNRALPSSIKEEDAEAPKTSFRRWLQFFTPPAPPCFPFCSGIPPGPAIVPTTPTFPTPSPPRPPKPTTPTSPSPPTRTSPLHFRVQNACHETVLFSLRYLEEDTGKWNSLCWWTIDPGDYVVLTKDRVRIDTYNSVAYFFALSKSYVWNGAGSAGSIHRTCGDYSLHMKKLTYVFENDLFVKLTCTKTRRLGSSSSSMVAAALAGEETKNGPEDEEEDEEEEINRDIISSMGCWSEEGMRIDGNIKPPPCLKGQLPLEDEQEMSVALKQAHFLELDGHEEEP